MRKGQACQAWWLPFWRTPHLDNWDLRLIRYGLAFSSLWYKGRKNATLFVHVGTRGPGATNSIKNDPLLPAAGNGFLWGAVSRSIARYPGRKSFSWGLKRCSRRSSWQVLSEVPYGVNKRHVRAVTTLAL